MLEERSYCRYTRMLTDCQSSCVIGRCQISCVMASQSRLRRRQAMTGFGSWRTQAEDTVSIRVYSGGCCQYLCVMAAGKSLLWLVSCQHSCVIVLSIRVYPHVRTPAVYPRMRGKRCAGLCEKACRYTRILTELSAILCNRLLSDFVCNGGAEPTPSTSGHDGVRFLANAG